MSSASQETAAF